MDKTKNGVEKQKSIALYISAWKGRGDNEFVRNFTIGKVSCEKLHAVWHFV